MQMAKVIFCCPGCGYEDSMAGTCPDCAIDLEETCAKCENPIEECVCETEIDLDEGKAKSSL